MKRKIHKTTRRNMFKRMIVAAICSICITVLVPLYQNIKQGNDALPAADKNTTIAVSTGKTYIPNKENDTMLMPVGAAIGIHIQAKGLMVLEVESLTDENGNKTLPASDILKEGDYILAVNGKKVETTEAMIAQVNASSGEIVTLTVERGEKQIECKITPARLTGGEYKIGAWIREDMQGIGTLSYVDAHNHFAALGHGIADIDTGNIVEIRDGNVYPADICTIIRGQQGTPGEIVGKIIYGTFRSFGTISLNNYHGIYGQLIEGSVYRYDAQKAVPAAKKEEIQIGRAQILCQVSGNIDTYEVAINAIDYNGSGKDRDFIVEVTDEALLKATGGIVRGMSGSPVLQNGKIIGVITHVFVNEPQRGYGIFIEKMMSQ